MNAPSWLVKKYIQLLSPQLDKFSWSKHNLAQFRCPLCGDSEKNSAKRRSYIFESKGTWFVKCHNCGIALPFPALLRRMSRTLYDAFLLESLGNNSHPFSDDAPEPPADAPEDLPAPGVLPSLADCKPLTHALNSVYLYVHFRGVADSEMSRLYATDRANSWILPLVGKDKAHRVADNIPYLVIPLRLPDGTWYGCQMRQSERKEYITFRWTHAPLKCFGLDTWDNSQTTYIVEGPMDALFIPNALAGCGSDLLGTAKILEHLKYLDPQLPVVFVWDNEPRNTDVVRHMKDAIAAQKQIVIWPREWEKDINDMVKAGRDPLSMIRKNTFSKLMAELEYGKWKR